VLHNNGLLKHSAQSSFTIYAYVGLGYIRLVHNYTAHGLTAYIGLTINYVNTVDSVHFLGIFGGLR